MTGQPAAGRHVGDDLEPPAQRLNEQVIQRLSRVAFELAHLAAAADDPHRRRELLECIDQLDVTLTRIRAAAVNVAGDGSSRHRPSPLP